jgi:hypothetical protein
MITALSASDVLHLLKSPAATIALSGGQDAAETYRCFTAPHPRFFFLQNKRWGAAILPLPTNFEDYLKDELLRRKRKRCLAHGYSFAEVDPNVRFEEIFAVNKSMAQRQGRDMDTCYVEPDALRKYYSLKRTTYAVLDTTGIVRAYASVPVYGEVFILSRLLGHGEHLGEGIMYLLVSEIVREMIGLRSERGAPNWGMYDTYFGAPAGLRFFKERLGFRPYNVKWVWRSPGVVTAQGAEV